MRLNSINTLALSGLALLLTIGANAQTITAAPNTMNFQGRLAKKDGTPVPDGVHTVTFRIYDAQTGGNVKWAEQIGSLNTKNGVFSAVLGRIFPFSDAILNGGTWLEIQIESDTPLLPRQQFQSVAYALKANTVPDGAITTAKIADGAITQAKLAPGVGGGSGTPTGTASGDLTGTYPNPLLALGSVTSGKLADNSVLSAKLADLAVIAAKLADSAVTTAKLSDNSVTAAKLADLAITAAKLANAAVTTVNLADGAVTSAKLASDPASLFQVSGGAMMNSGTLLNIFAPLTVAGQIQSTTGGIKFPDGTVQTTAAQNTGLPSGSILFTASPNNVAGYDYIGYQAWSLGGGGGNQFWYFWQKR